MQVTSGFVQAMRNAGLDVVEMSGWQGRGEGGNFNIRGLLLHHDAMGLHNDNVPQYMSQNGVNGSQLWIKYTGQVYVMAAGLKWHAGAGGGFRNIPAQSGNAYCVGVETDYSGSGPRPAAIDEAIHILTRVAVVYYGMNPQRDLALHKEYAPDRKQDLSNFDADAWRARAGLAQTGGPVTPSKPTQTPAPQPTTPTPVHEDEEDMYKLIVGNGSSTGAVFAASPGRFFHVESPAHLDAGTKAGLWSGNITVVDIGELDIIRDIALGNGAGKDDNLPGSGVLPSDIAQGKA